MLTIVHYAVVFRDNLARLPSERLYGGFLGVKYLKEATPVINSAAESAHLVENYTAVPVPSEDWNDFTLGWLKG